MRIHRKIDRTTFAGAAEAPLRPGALGRVARQNRGWLALYALLGVAIAFVGSGKAALYQQVIDGLAAGKPAAGALLAYGAALAAGCILPYLDEYPSRRLTEKCFLDLKLLALEKLSRMDYLAYQRLGAGEVIQRIESGAEAGRDMLLSFWLRLGRELLPAMAFGLVFIWRIRPGLTCALLGGYALVALIAWGLMRQLLRMKERLLSHQERLNHVLVRGLMEMTTFRVERRFPRELARARREAAGMVDAQAKLGMVHEAFFAAFALLVGALELGLLAYAGASGSLSVGEAVALVALMQNVYTPIAIWNVLLIQYRLDKAAYGRLADFLGAPEDPRLASGEAVMELAGAVQVTGLRFAYAGRAALEGVSFTLRPGERVALAGESGSGKSTLAKLLCGLLKYSQGSVRWDGRELSALQLDSLYQHLGYVGQEAPVFDGTLRENLTNDPACPDARLRRALAQAQLTPLLQQLPQGLDTPLGERGTALSGGERQRVALARQFLAPKQALILDEATSALDDSTEAAVMAEVFRAWAGRTVICVTHRLRAVRGCDRILLLRDGRIVGDAPYDVLLRENAYFQALVQAEAE